MMTRASIALLVAVSALGCHRESRTAASEGRSARSEQRTANSQRRVLFVGLDGADWHYLDQLMAAGVMPNLQQLVHAGRRGPLLTQQPPLSPLVWTTMMTGVSPLEHRILDFTRFNPISHTLEPITSDERAVPALWNMVAAKGKRAAVFGMWATYPAEPGVLLTDRDGSLHANAAGSATDALQRVREETENIHAAAKSAIARDHPDLAIVYFEGTDAIGHLLAGRDNDTARRYFARIDAILGDYRELARKEDADLVIASDHGFDWSAAHPAESSTNAVTAAKWHRDEGIFLFVDTAALTSLPQRNPDGGYTVALDGPMPKYRQRLAQKVIDVAPLLLEILRLPSDVREYRRGYHPPAPAAAPAGGSEELAKLTALGYIGAAEGAHGPAGNSTRTAGSFNNEGLILRNDGRDDEAAAAYEGALHVDPKNAAALWNLSDLLRHQGRDAKRAEALLDAAIDADPHQPRWLLTRGRFALERHDCRAALADFQRAVTLMPDAAIVYTSRGTAEACLGDEQAAKADFRRSLKLDPHQPELARFLH
jgi:tetratricopeptide (TPR) repeat protein